MERSFKDIRRDNRTLLGLKNILISTLGLAPGVVTEVIDELSKRGTRISEVIVLATRSALPSYWALKLDLERGPHRGRIGLERVDLPFQDIDSEGDCTKFRRILADLIRKKLKEGTIHLSIAGGRKVAHVESLLVAMALGVENVYHIIAEEIRGPTLFSSVQDLYDLESYATSSEPPESLMRMILDICHPTDLTLHLIKIPIPHLPQAAREGMVKELGL